MDFMILMRANLLLGPLEGMGLKHLDFQGPPLPMPLEIEIAHIKIISSRVPPHLNNRYINSYHEVLNFS